MVCYCEKDHKICAGSCDTLQTFVKYGNTQHKLTKTSFKSVIMAGGPGGFERQKKKQQMTELPIRNQCMLDSLACQNQSFA